MTPSTTVYNRVPGFVLVAPARVGSFRWSIRQSFFAPRWRPTDGYLRTIFQYFHKERHVWYSNPRRKLGHDRREHVTFPFCIVMHRINHKQHALSNKRFSIQHQFIRFSTQHSATPSKQQHPASNNSQQQQHGIIVINSCRTETFSFAESFWSPTIASPKSSIRISGSSSSSVKPFWIQSSQRMASCRKWNQFNPSQ